jgi:hypothetical protein
MLGWFLSWRLKRIGILQRTSLGEAARLFVSLWIRYWVRVAGLPRVRLTAGSRVLGIENLTGSPTGSNIQLHSKIVAFLSLPHISQSPS